MKNNGFEITFEAMGLDEILAKTKELNGQLITLEMNLERINKKYGILAERECNDEQS